MSVTNYIMIGFKTPLQEATPVWHSTGTQTPAIFIMGSSVKLNNTIILLNHYTNKMPHMFLCF